MNVGETCRLIEQLAPLHLAQDWDNVGLLAGDASVACSRALVCVDFTPEVLAEALAKRCQLVVAYHPPLFRPLQALRAGSRGTDAVVWRAIRENIAIFSMHTALDAAEGGTNDVLAQLCGAVDAVPFSFTEQPRSECKVVVFAPAAEVDGLAEAMAGAGAGTIGDYTRCSFRITGSGTFLGGGGSTPTVGRAGHYETVDEIRLEMVTPADRLTDVVAAIRRTHSYEEPAFDIYPLRPPPLAGLGRLGRLQPVLGLGELIDRLAQALAVAGVHYVGDLHDEISRVAVCVGAAGSEPLKLGLRPGDCVVTGELRHHDALTLRRSGAAAAVLGHWTSERPGVAALAERLAAKLDDVEILLSERDREPLRFAAP